jgi:hypothetical protein
MAIVLYECNKDFPIKIPAILSTEGLTVSADGKHRPGIKKGKNPFAYRVSDGVCTVDVSGGEDERDGFVGFFVFPRWSWSIEVILKRKLFQQRVSVALLQEGVRVWQAKD